MRRTPVCRLAGAARRRPRLTVAPAGRQARRWRVGRAPVPPRITITGHGYGHGHGMSQYGAEGAARQGLTYRQIAEFYYPGTAWGDGAGPGHGAAHR